MIPDVYYNKDSDSFAFQTARVRWLKIVEDCVEDIEAVGITASPEAQQQAATIAAKLKALKSELVSDGVVPLLTGSLKQYESYNRALEGKNFTWLSGPWLLLENVLYRIINEYFLSERHWFNYDIFANLKEDSFESSVAGVTELAVRYSQLDQQHKSTKNISPDIQELLFKEFSEISLWGNATDLSLLATATLDDIASIQGAAARKKSEDKILTNDITQAYNQLISCTSKSKSVDIVLDNSGFELYTDLVFALFLLDFQLCDKVTLHTKDIPWMVSDVNIKDFNIVLSQLKDITKFPDNRDQIDFLVDKVEYFYNVGKLALETSPFWTLDLDFWSIDPNEKEFGGAELHQRLLSSSLVIFKGDMNYRKLTADRRWPSTTSFTTAVGPLASSGLKVLSLRTVKADVLVGLPEGVYEQVSDEWAKTNDNRLSWLYSGKYAVISFSSGTN